MLKNSDKSPIRSFSCKNQIVEWMANSFHRENSSFEIPNLSEKNWLKIISEAHALGLNSRLIEILHGANLSQKIPLGIFTSLSTARLLAHHRNLLLLDAFERISQALRSADIPHQAIKGIWILQQPELRGLSRITSDIDLLIEPENIGLAAVQLRSMGFQQDPCRTRKDFVVKHQNGHHISPFRKQGLSVEIHYRSLPGSSTNFNQKLLHDSSYSDHFCVIFLHFIRHLQHGDRQIKWLADIMRQFNELKQEDFPQIMECIQSDQHADLGIKIFEFLMKWSLSDTTNILITELQNYLDHSDNQSILNLKLFFRSLPRGLPGLVSFFASIFPRSEYLRFIYPKAINYPVGFLYLYRWYQLGRKLSLFTLRSLKIF